MRKRYEEEIRELKESFDWYRETCDRTIKSQQEQIEKLKVDFGWHKETFNKYKAEVVQRKYLIETKFKGTIKNKKLLEELKMAKFDYSHTEVKSGFGSTNLIKHKIVYEVTTNGLYSYEEVCKNISSYDLECVNCLYTLIKDLEKKQKLLDKYKEQ